MNLDKNGLMNVFFNSIIHIFRTKIQYIFALFTQASILATNGMNELNKNRVKLPGSMQQLNETKDKHHILIADRLV